MSVRWIDKLEEKTEWSVKQSEASPQERRIVDLEAQVSELTEWITAIGDDMITRTQGGTHG